MFSLIVKGMAWADGQDRFPSSRVFEYTDAEFDTRFRPNGVLDIAALSQLPTVFVEETSGRGDQVARIGRLVGGHLVGREFVLEYAYDPAIPPLTNRHFQSFAAELGIADFQFSRTHWSVKSGDLFRSLLRNLQPRRSRPTVFQIQDPEAIEPTLVSAMMPFHPNFTPVYAALQQVAAACDLRCRRRTTSGKTQQLFRMLFPSSTSRGLLSAIAQAVTPMCSMKPALLTRCVARSYLSRKTPRTSHSIFAICAMFST